MATTVIQGATLIDGTGAPPLSDTNVIVSDSRIVEAGPGAAAPPGSRVLDARGMTIMPGIIDSHDHLVSHGYDLAGRHNLNKPLSLVHLETAAILEDTLASGTTAVRDAAGLDRGFKLAVDQGLIAGPRLKVALAFISPTGGVSDYTTVSGHEFAPQAGIPPGVADGPDAARAKVREMVRAGADVIKTATTGGVSSARHAPLEAQYSRPELEAIVDEARILDRRVMCHALGGPGLRMAVEVGVHSIEHGSYLDLDPELAKMMADKGIFYVPTFMVYVYHAGERGAPYMRERAAAMREHHVRSLQIAIERGVSVAMGTDAGGYVHGLNAMELELMVKAGLSPMEAIVASTRTAAACMEMDREVGTIEPGMLADLLVVDGDPLKDIAVLQNRDRLALIMQGGNVVKCTLPAQPLIA